MEVEQTGLGLKQNKTIMPRLEVGSFISVL